jgi:hypothetical protein
MKRPRSPRMRASEKRAPPRWGFFVARSLAGQSALGPVPGTTDQYTRSRDGIVFFEEQIIVDILSV